MGKRNKFFDFMDRYWVVIVGLFVVFVLFCLKIAMGIVNGGVV
jgi:hypothetical protein